MKSSLMIRIFHIPSSEYAFFRFLKKGYPLILMGILLTSLVSVFNIEPIAAQEIVDVESPTQVRVNSNFWVNVLYHYEVDGPAGLHIEIQILEEETGDLQGEHLSDPMFPDPGHHEGETSAGVQLIAPDSVGVWELNAVLSGGNEMRFSVEVVGDDFPPSVTITSLEADLDSLQLGDFTNIHGTVDYSIPEGSSFLIIVTTSYGAPPSTLFYYSGGPWALIPEFAYEMVLSDLYRAGDPGLWGTSVPSSGMEDFFFVVNAPLEPLDWTLYFRVLYFSPEGEEIQLGSRELTIEVSTRSEMWARLDTADSDPTSPGDIYRVIVSGRYFFLDEEPHTIRIAIWNTVLGEYLSEGGSHEIPDVTGSGSFFEVLNPRAPLAIGEYSYSAHLLVDDDLKDSFDFVVIVGIETVIEYELEIVNVESVPEVRYGESFDVEMLVRYDLPDDPLDSDSTLTCLIGSGIMACFAFDSISVRGAGESTILLNVPSEYVPPRNGPLNLLAFASARNEPVIRDLVDFSEFTVDIVGAEEGIEGGSSDWKAIDGWTSFPTPFGGVDIRFWAILQVDTSDPLPQQVWLTLDVDGSDILREAIVYQPDMDYYAFQSSPLWTATPGEHIAVWRVDPDRDYTDPNLDNNEFQIRFTVEESPPPFIPPEGEEPPQPDEEFDFYVTANPTERTLASSVSYTVNVELSSGEPETVQLNLMGAPAGVSHSFNPSSNLPPYSSELTITGSQSLPAGTYNMMIEASDGEKTRYKPIILRVEEGADYELSASPRVIQAQPGETVEYTISASSDSGYNQYVNLVVSDLPSSLTSRLESSAGIPDFETALHVDVGEDVTPRVYHITVTGSGPEPKSATFTLNVRAPLSEETTEEDRSALTYYLPLLYLIVIIAVVISSVVLGIRRVRGRPVKTGAFCIECGKKIPFGTEFCPKCGVKQEREE